MIQEKKQKSPELNHQTEDKMKKICHLTSAHEPEDDRIFLKECVSLAENGYDTYLIAKGNTYDKSGVHITGISDIPESRMKRMLRGGKMVYRKALEVNADIYHLHDPELLPYALKLKNKGKTVFFDSHEDVPGQIMDKTWIMKPLRSFVSKLYRSYETHIVRKIDAVITATPHIAEKFAGRAKKTEVINNYPRLDDVIFHDTPFTERGAVICYAGAVDVLRGEDVMREAMHSVKGELLIAGDHEAIRYPEENTEYLGRLDRKGINDLYGKSVAGLCVLKPTQNYYYSQPIKMYEYMAAGIPFICSDFPLWAKVAKDSGAGICVDPSDPAMLSQCINDLLNDREKAQQMGRNGYCYVTGNCTWAIEEKKLVSLYEAYM